MNYSRAISRRTLLRGIGGATLSLPLLDIMRAPATAAGTANPVRLCYLYFPNGCADDAWKPQQVDANGQLQELNKWMSPLDEFKSDLIIPRRMWTPRGNGHGAGTATWLTGKGYDGREIDAGGASADQLAARTVGAKTLLPSLELSLRGEGFFSNSLVRNTISWSDARTPVPREDEPRSVFDRMFRVGNRSVSDRALLDSVLEDARSLKRRVSQADRRRIEEYLESLRSIERRVQFADEQTQRAKDNPALQKHLVRPAAGIPDDHGEYMRLMLDCVALAFWADATRVCTLMLDHGQSNRYFNFIDDVQGTWHALSHWRDASGRTEDDDGVTSWASPAQKRAMYNRVTRWHHEQIANFLGRLRAFHEADGSSLLDNSLVLYGSSLADGHEHAARNLPLILAGRGGGTVATGREVSFGRDTSLSRLHLAMLQRVDPAIQQFAEAKQPLDLS